MFHHSDLAEPGWPKSICEPSFDRTAGTVLVFRVLFALIYGAELTYETFPGWKEPKWRTATKNWVGMQIVSAVCAYAHYYQCLDLIKPNLVRIMQSAPDYWYAVCWELDLHLDLA